MYSGAVEIGLVDLIYRYDRSCKNFKRMEFWVKRVRCIAEYDVRPGELRTCYR